MQKDMKVTKKNLFLISLIWLPIIALFAVWVGAGHVMAFEPILVGIIISVLGGYSTVQVLQIDELDKREKAMKESVRSAHAAICDTCPFKMLALNAPFHPEGYKRDYKLESRRETVESLSVTSSSVKELEAPVLATPPR